MKVITNLACDQARNSFGISRKGDTVTTINCGNKDNNEG